MNKQNVRSGGTELPEEQDQEVLDSPIVLAWCIISNELILTTCCFEIMNVIGESYAKMLIRFAFRRLHHSKQNYIFPQCNASPHYSNKARDHLKVRRPNNWVGRVGRAAQQPGSPGLTPCGFILWPHVKRKIYSKSKDSIEELKRRLTVKVPGISKETLKSMNKHKIAS